jgi:hypothetical protein
MESSSQIQTQMSSPDHFQLGPAMSAVPVEAEGNQGIGICRDGLCGLMVLPGA